MVDISKLTQNEILKLGLSALVKELGPIGMVRFLNQFENGNGDYTKDREKWLNGIDFNTIKKDFNLKEN